jgi:hypothetical protein
MKYFIKLLWQLPQNIFGFALKLILVRRKEIDYIIPSQVLPNVEIIVKSSKLGGAGISLGNYIFISDYFYEKEIVIKHEEGHCIQSIIFGPFYLFFIGLPSITQYLISSYLKKLGMKKFSDNYFNRWPENWADKLGKVIRS